MQNQERTLASQLGPFFDQPPETPQEERAESIANQPILIISSDSSTTDEEDDEEEEEEEEDDTDEEPVIFDTVRAPTNRPQRQQLPRLVSSIAGYRSLSRDKQKRAERAMTQRMFILSRETLDDYCEEFEVIGTVGSAYNIKIAQTLSCSCIDFSSQFSHCKHILMILLKVYRLEFTSSLYRTLNANYEDRKNAIINSVHDASAFVTDQVRERINQVLYQTETTNRPIAQQHALDHSDCAICFDPFNESERANVDYCWVCGNNVHKQCMERWKATRTGADAANPKCIYCNQKWHIPPTIPGENRRRDVSELDSRHVDDYGYVNLAQEAGLSSHRPDYNPFFSTRRRRRRRRYNYDYGYDSNCDCECCDHDEFERYEGDCDCECCFHS